jgi:CBS-domain-containing membrane protein
MAESRVEVSRKQREPCARDVMTTAMITLDPGDDISRAVTAMVREGVRHLPVVEAGGKLVGIVSDRNLRERFGDLIDAFVDSAKGGGAGHCPVERTTTFLVCDASHGAAPGTVERA